MKILSILNELAATASINDKVAILQREKNNELLKRVFQAAYNPMITYGIKQIPAYAPRFTSSSGYTLQTAIDSLGELSSRSITGNAAIHYLDDVLHTLFKDDATVIERIIQRDLRCGTSDSLASRVWPGFVPTFDVMLAHKDISGITFPAYGQIKSDGARCHLYFDGVHAQAFSRNGKPIELHGVLDNDIACLILAGQTLDGELLCYRDGKVLDRKTGNGIINKAVKGTITKEEAELIRFVTWDIVDFTSTILYFDRIKTLVQNEMHAKRGATPFQGKIIVLETVLIKNKEEAGEFFEKCILAGEEGAMIKNLSGKWVPKRSKDIGKMKASEVADLIIVGMEEGGGKYTGMLGAFICETSDGKLQVNVGTGFSDAERSEYATSAMIGKIIEVGYNQVITSKGKEESSLFLPRFEGVRFDKKVANTLGELK